MKTRSRELYCVDKRVCICVLPVDVKKYIYIYMR